MMMVAVKVLLVWLTVVVQQQQGDAWQPVSTSLPPTATISKTISPGRHVDNNNNGRVSHVSSSFHLNEGKEGYDRREVITTAMSIGLSTMTSLLFPTSARAEEGTTALLPEVQVTVSGDAKKLFGEARALESQGNMAAAQRLYAKVTKISPRFIYGWSNLGNTQVAFGQLNEADENYSKAIELCRESMATTEEKFGVRKCNDLYLLLLNRGSVRLNNGMIKEALVDLEKSSALRDRPDAVVTQNLARARELNGLYAQADRDYNLAISMTANEVNPFWLRSSMVKFQLGDIKGGMDILKRVENRFPEAPEVRAAYAAFLAAQGDQIAAQRKYLEIPDRQRLKYVDNDYLTKTLYWPPAMIDTLKSVSSAAGDTAQQPPSGAST